MKNTKVTLVPLTADDREQFILDNQWAFKYGAIEEFGMRDDHMDFDGEIISRKTIERCIDSPDSETYRIVVDGRRAGDLIRFSRRAHQGHRIWCVACGRGSASRNQGLGDLHALF